MAYLSGLSVTVLIVYVMNPPVRDAIEGAYVVAVIITGAILGALAVVFPEVTEGLGCLLGGFCLSMWCMLPHRYAPAVVLLTFRSFGLEARRSHYLDLWQANHDWNLLLGDIRPGVS